MAATLLPAMALVADPVTAPTPISVPGQGTCGQSVRIEPAGAAGWNQIDLALLPCPEGKPGWAMAYRMGVAGEPRSLDPVPLVRCE